MGRKLALIIGNSRYDDTGLARLPTADVDVRELAEVLRAPEIGHFDETLELPDMGLAVVRRSIAQFFSQARKDDLLVFYFSGHGVKDENGHLYLAVRDTELKLLSGTSIEAAYITAQMDRSVSRRQVLILDCCHSGAFAQGAKASAAQVVGTGPAFEGTGYGHVVLTATDSTQYAWEGDRVIGDSDKSVFTHYILQGLRTGEADLDGDGRITVDELYEYVYEQVVRETPKQTPGKWSYKQQGDIVVAKNLKPQARTAALPLELQAMIESAIPRIREEAVSELKTLLQSKHPGFEAAARKALEQLCGDDSRKVSAAAQGAVAEISRTEHAEAERGRKEQERQAREHQQQEREASERAARDALSIARRRIEDLLRREELDQAAASLAQAEHDSGDVTSLGDLRQQYQTLRMRREEIERRRVQETRRAQEEAARREAEKRSGPVPDTLLMVPDRQALEETRGPRAVLIFVRESRWLQSALVLMLIAIGVVGWQLVQPSGTDIEIFQSPTPAPQIETPPVEITPPKVAIPAPVDPKPPQSTGPVAASGGTTPPPPKPAPGPGGPSGSVTPPVNDDATISRLLSEGDALLKSARYKDAIAKYEESARLGSAEGFSRAARARDEQRTQVRQRLNRVGGLLDAGDYGEALRLIDEALTRDSDSAEATSLRQKALDAQNFERASKSSAENPFTQRQVETALKVLSPGRLAALIKEFGATFIFDANDERQFRATAAGAKIDPPQVDAIVRLLAPPRDRAAGAEWTAPTDHRQMVWVPAGTFQMGSPGSEAGREADEASHVATIAGGFWMESTEVTYRAFQKFVLANPEWQKARIDRRLHDGNYLSDWKGNAFPPGKADAPVVHVSWYAAQAYAKWAGKRLPTEAEWEYACRAGRRTTYWWGDSFDAAPSGGASARNPWGLSATLGGVWEWTSSLYRNYPFADDGRNDPAAQGPRVIRGGAGTSGPGILRSANRNRDEPERCSDLLGFRCVY